MAEPSEPLRDGETGLVGELARRPNPDGLVIWPMPPIETLIATRQQELGRELTAEEIETQRRKAPAIVVTKDVAEGIMVERARRPMTVQTTSPVRHPTVKSSYDAMPTEAVDRNEAAVELFGQHVFSCRNALIERLRWLIEAAGARGGMGTLHRKEFDAVAALEPAGREVALALARKAIDLYLQEILTLFTGTGHSLSFGSAHAVNYRLSLQVKEVSSDQVVEEFDVNRECQKVFYTYYARWLNRYADHR